MNLNKMVVFAAWLLSLVVSAIAITVWVQCFNGEITLNNYSLFPLFGLLAFSLMWVHYIVGALRRYFAVDKKHLKIYYKVTSVTVLLAILLHPGLFIYQLWRNGYGLPPESYKYYVASSAVWAVMLGTIALWIFLAFETKRVFGKKQWWKLVECAQILAMVLIYIHALQLGGEIQTGWYKVVWVFYGLSFLAASTYIFIKDRGESK
ncbi:hypothetical protein KC960_01880 [Candidatus Saccharibacteria bacterium]|nr:hypothetical protein [Candidatus Saccharibacteria bacterium]